MRTEKILEDLKKKNQDCDLRTSNGALTVLMEADRLGRRVSGNVEVLRELEAEMFVGPNRYCTFAHLVAKTALSKAIVDSIKGRTHLSIVVPMFHEERRMAPRLGSTLPLGQHELAQDEHGENALLRKNTELGWLTKDNSRVSWDLIFVDDICDRGSGEIANRLIAKNELTHSKVLFLKDALEACKTETLTYRAIETIIQNGGQSIRGGALCLGFAYALENFDASLGNQLVGYMDADASYSAAQLGIPLRIALNSETYAITASRQHPLTYMETPGGESQTSHRSPGLIRLKQLVGYLRKHIVGDKVPADTQSGFKLLRPEILRRTLLEPGKAHNFSYDTQLLARISRMSPERKVIETFGVTVLDCDELSTANNGLTYFAALDILRIIANEAGYNHLGRNESWILDHLASSVDNYKTAIRLLEEGSKTGHHREKYDHLLSTVRSRIRTDKDTTAVGSYFTPDICEDFAEVLAVCN